MTETGTSRGGEPGARRKRIVVVPRRPGPLRDLDAAGAASHDDLDELIDEVFGPAPQDRPGIFDIVLVVGGIILFAWGLATSAATIVLLAAGAAVILGLALPLRSLVRTARRRGTDRRWRRALGTGYPLDVSHPATAALAHAYEASLAALALPGVELGEPATEPAHLALVEVATLLAGVPPVGVAQVEYVDKRTQAIRRVSDEIERAHREWLEANGAAGPRTLRRREVWATAVTEAREEFEAGDGHSSLEALGRLHRELARGTGDGRS